MSTNSQTIVQCCFATEVYFCVTKDVHIANVIFVCVVYVAFKMTTEVQFNA